MNLALNPYVGIIDHCVRMYAGQTEVSTAAHTALGQLRNLSGTEATADPGALIALQYHLKEMTTNPAFPPVEAFRELLRLRYRILGPERASEAPLILHPPHLSYLQKLGVIARKDDPSHPYFRAQKHSAASAKRERQLTELSNVFARKMNIEIPPWELEQALKEAFSDLLGLISDRDAKIFHARFLSPDLPTLQELGKEFGLSKERTRHLEAQALYFISDHIARSRSPSKSPLNRKHLEASLQGPPDHRYWIGKLQENPEDHETWRVFGDWLLQCGDARGEMILTEMRMAEMGRQGNYEEAFRLLERKREFDGRLTQEMHARLGRKSRRYRFFWRRGYLSELKCTAATNFKQFLDVLDLIETPFLNHLYLRRYRDYGGAPDWGQRDWQDFFNLPQLETLNFLIFDRCHFGIEEAQILMESPRLTSLVRLGVAEPQMDDETRHILDDWSLQTGVKIAY